jgi:hypothetical protein
MMKLLSRLAAATFTVAALTPVALAGETKGDTVADACKGKQAGEEVTVAGEKVKCPAPKK